MEYQNIILGFLIGLPSLLLSIYSGKTAGKKASADIIGSLNETVEGLVKSRGEMIARLIIVEKENKETKGQLLEYVRGSGLLYYQLVDKNSLPSWTPPHITPEEKVMNSKWD